LLESYERASEFFKHLTELGRCISFISPDRSGKKEVTDFPKQEGTEVAADKNNKEGFGQEDRNCFSLKTKTVDHRQVGKERTIQSVRRKEGEKRC